MTMYALPSLTNWDTSSGGWSNSSGGPSNGSAPTSSTPVVFDNNSGVARTIGNGSGGGVCQYLTITSGAPLIAFSGGRTIYGDVSVSGAHAFSGGVTLAGTTQTLNFGAASVSALTVSSGVTATLGAALIVSGAVSNGAGTASFNAANFDVTAGSFQWNAGTITMGSGTWTVTTTDIDVSNVTLNANTSTLKLTGSGAQVLTMTGKTLNNVWNANTGAGVQISGGGTLSNLRIEPGATQKFQSSTTTTIASLTADGTLSRITLAAGSAGSAATLAKSGGGALYLDNYSIKDITGSPGATWYARNSLNVSGNSGITFIPPNTRFFSFL